MLQKHWKAWNLMNEENSLMGLNSRNVRKSHLGTMGYFRTYNKDDVLYTYIYVFVFIDKNEYQGSNNNFILETSYL